MKKRSVLPAFVLVLCAAAQGAPWKSEGARVRVDFPKGWEPVTARIADKRRAESREAADSSFYAELARRLRAGRFHFFEQRKTGRRADLQYTSFGSRLRELREQDIRNLCPRWAEDNAEQGLRMIGCGPMKLGTAWVARMEFQADPGGVGDHQIQRFDTSGTHVVFTLRGTRAEADSLFKRTRFF
jgi:hypothetical protein